MTRNLFLLLTLYSVSVFIFDREPDLELDETLLYFNSVQKTGSRTFVRLFKQNSNEFKKYHVVDIAIPSVKGNFSRQWDLTVQVR